MPYLRFSRDTNGYENTYVLHTFRREGRSHPRLLYWFRTPPNVKMGRLPLDEEAIRAIEESNPDLSFDWTKMLKVKKAPLAKEAQRARSVDGKVVEKRERRAEERSKPASESTLANKQRSDQTHGLTQAAKPEAIPEVVEGDDVDQTAEEVEWQHPVSALMGDDTLARLRARYAEVQVRITEKLVDPVSLSEMRTRAEVLNPDGWLTTEAAVRGIERFEAEVEAIKALLGRRRPRSRQRGSRQ